MIDQNQSLAVLVAEYPSAGSIFSRYQLDYCCGGHESLVSACAQKGCDPAEIVREIGSADGAEQEPAITTDDWADKPIDVLVEFLQQEFHPIPEQDLSEFVEMARRVETVHALFDACPAGLADLLSELDDILRRHMTWEASLLFPAIRTGHSEQHLQQAVDGHGQIDQCLDAIQTLTHNFTVPEGGCATWSRLVNGLHELHSALTHYLDLEQTYLFKRPIVD